MWWWLIVALYAPVRLNSTLYLIIFRPFTTKFSFYKPLINWISIAFWLHFDCRFKSFVETEPQRWTDNKMCVQDIFEHKRNVTNAIRLHELKAFKLFCVKSLAIIGEIGGSVKYWKTKTIFPSNMHLFFRRYFFSCQNLIILIPSCIESSRFLAVQTI